MPEINIAVASRRASAATTRIISGNGDYTVNFVFDAEWADITAKTMRVTLDNGQYVDTPFTGTSATLPAVTDTRQIRIGVTAGDLATTGAVIACIPSIKDGAGQTVDLTQTMYDQLMAVINGMELSGDMTDEAVNELIAAYVTEHSIGGMTDEQEEQLEAAYDAKHTHENAEVLDGITAAMIAAWNAGGGSCSDTYYSGKTLVAFGASIIANGTVMLDAIQTALGLTSYTNKGVGGASITGTAAKIAATDCSSFDVALVQFGTNNFNQEIELGSLYPVETAYADMDTATFYGGLQACIAGLLEDNPAIDIFIVTTTKRPYDDAAADTAINDIGLRMRDYINAAKRVANLYAVPVIDWWNTACISDVNSSTFSDDGTHPNDLGYQRLGHLTARAIATRAFPSDCDGSYKYYPVTWNLTNCAVNTSPAWVAGALTATITSTSGSAISAIVRMNGKTITALVYANGVVTIPEVIGEVVITAISAAPEAVLSSIAATKTETAYNVGATLATSDITVMATYDNASTANVTASCTFDTSDVDMTTAGTYSIGVTYTEDGVTKTTTVSITVAAAGATVLSSISAAKTTAAYVVGDTLATSDITVTAHYSDSSTANVTASCTINTTGVTMSASGTYSIGISYTEDGVTKTASVSITVAASSEWDIEWDGSTDGSTLPSGLSLVNGVATWDSTNSCYNNDSTTLEKLLIASSMVAEQYVLEIDMKKVSKGSVRSYVCNGSQRQVITAKSGTDITTLSGASLGTLTLNEWHTFRFELTSTLDVYLDGVQIGTDLSLVTASDTDAYITFGAVTEGNAAAIKGLRYKATT